MPSAVAGMLDAVAAPGAGDRADAARAVTTARLDLRPVVAGDLDALFAITSDPATWRHAPHGRHTDPATTRDWIARAAARWDTDGLSYWLVRRRDDDAVIGVGGTQRQPTGNWNLYYRFAPSAWGRGYATELGRAALEAAHAADDTVAVIAWVAPANTASVQVARRLGLREAGLHRDPSDGGMRVAFTDRETVFDD